MSAHTIRQHFAPSNCPDPIVRMHDESRRHIPFGIVDAVSRSSNSNQNAKSLPTPHISGSYRLRRHFPRYCDVSTRISHSYRIPLLRPRAARTRNGRIGGPDHRPADLPEREPFPQREIRRSGPRITNSRCAVSPAHRTFYQLAFFTPGIRPFEAISRNWIRLMPNRRI